MKTFIQDNDRRICIVELELKKQKGNINHLVMTSDNNDTLCLVNDISGMYIHYMFNPKYSELKINPSTWSTFLRMKFLSVKVNFIKKKQINRGLERRPPMQDDEIEADIAKLYKSIEKEFQVNLRDLR